MALVVGCIALAVPLSGWIRGPGFVERITFENQTDFDLLIDVTDSRRSGWVHVANARHGQATTAQEVLDQGNVWIFRFASQGEAGGELRLPRSQLERDDWNVIIPSRIGDELRARGAPPSP